MTAADTAADTAALRADLTRRLAPHLPPAAVAPVADAVAQFAGPSAGDDPAELRKAAIAIATHACPPQYRPLLIGLAVVEQAVSAWLAARVVEVTAGSATVTDRR